MYIQVQRLNRQWSLNHTALLPLAPENFFGRNDFVASALSVLESGEPSRLAIRGPGGIGKTATALTILQHGQMINQFQDRRFFVSCQAISTADTLATNILNAVGIKHNPQDNLMHTLSRGLKANSPLLLVLDNFETPWER